MRIFVASIATVLTSLAASAQTNDVESVVAGCKSGAEACEAAVGTYVDASIFNQSARGDKVIKALTAQLCSDSIGAASHQSGIVAALSSMRPAIASRSLGRAATECDESADSIAQAAANATNGAGQSVTYVPSPA